MRSARLTSQFGCWPPLYEPARSSGTHNCLFTFSPDSRGGSPGPRAGVSRLPPRHHTGLQRRTDSRSGRFANPGQNWNHPQRQVQRARRSALRCSSAWNLCHFRGRHRLQRNNGCCRRCRRQPAYSRYHPRSPDHSGNRAGPRPRPIARQPAHRDHQQHCENRHHLRRSRRSPSLRAHLRQYFPPRALHRSRRAFRSTKARITAVSFGGSSGLNVDLSVDGGDNNDDYIGGFLQNFSPEAMQEFVVRTSQFGADTSRTNGGSIILSTRRGTDDWHGSLSYYYRGQNLNARNALDNPEPNPKQPFSRQNAVAALGGPMKTGKLWFFTSYEYVHENASVAYSAKSLSEFSALAQLAAAGDLPNITSIGGVPTSVPVPFRDTLFSSRLDWTQSSRSQWFVRGSFDRNHTRNDLLQQGALPSTGATTTSNYYNILLNNQFQFTPSWLGTLTLEASGFHHTKARNSAIGEALTFPFTVSFLTTSGLETFGDNQFATAIAAFPVHRDQQKYQFRYDVSRASGSHAVRFGVNLIHEPVLRGALASNLETVFTYPQDPSFYVANPGVLSTCSSLNPDPNCPAVDTTGPADGSFSQSIRRLGFYAEDSWRVKPSFTLNAGLRYDTTFGLFIASGHDQSLNPALPGNGVVTGVPHDYRKAFAPRLGIAYAPHSSSTTVFRAGLGLYYNDLAQNGWVAAFTDVKNFNPQHGTGPAALIDPKYHTPYALPASAAYEHAFRGDWRLSVTYEHQQGVHQYRRYEFPAFSLFRSDNRSIFNGLALQMQHSF